MKKAEALNFQVILSHLSCRKSSFGLLSGTSAFKCTNQLYTGWYETDFDHSSWPAALDVNASLHSHFPEEDLDGAAFVWDSANSGTVYCRARACDSKLPSSDI